MNEKDKELFIEIAKCVKEIYERLKEISEKLMIPLDEVVYFAVNVIPQHLNSVNRYETIKTDIEKSLNIKIDRDSIENFIKLVEKTKEEKHEN